MLSGSLALAVCVPQNRGLVLSDCLFPVGEHTVHSLLPSLCLPQCWRVWCIWCMWCVRSFYVMCFCVRPNHSHAKRLGTRPASLLFHVLLASKEPVAVVLLTCLPETLKPFGSARPSVLCPSLPARSFHGITASASLQARIALSAQEPSPPSHL